MVIPMTGCNLTKQERPPQGARAARPRVPKFLSSFILHPLAVPKRSEGGSFIENPCKNKKIQANRAQSWQKMCASAGPALCLSAIRHPLPCIAPGCSRLIQLNRAMEKITAMRPACILKEITDLTHLTEITLLNSNEQQ